MKDGNDRKPAPPGQPTAPPPAPPKKKGLDQKKFAADWIAMEKRMEARGLTNGF
jgi:hypothetical protein